MNDAVSSSEMETASESVYQHLAIKCTQLVRRQGNYQLQYETYCAQLEVVVQTSPWSSFLALLHKHQYLGDAQVNKTN